MSKSRDAVEAAGAVAGRLSPSKPANDLGFRDMTAVLGIPGFTQDPSSIPASPSIASTTTDNMVCTMYVPCCFFTLELGYYMVYNIHQEKRNGTPKVPGLQGAWGDSKMEDTSVPRKREQLLDIPNLLGKIS